MLDFKSRNRASRCCNKNAFKSVPRGVRGVLFSLEIAPSPLTSWCACASVMAKHINAQWLLNHGKGLCLLFEKGPNKRILLDNGPTTGWRNACFVKGEKHMREHSSHGVQCRLSRPAERYTGPVAPPTQKRMRSFLCHQKAAHSSASLIQTVRKQIGLKSTVSAARSAPRKCQSGSGCGRGEACFDTLPPHPWAHCHGQSYCGRVQLPPSGKCALANSNTKRCTCRSTVKGNRMSDVIWG